MTAREAERDLCSVRHYIQIGDWLQCKLPHYISAKNELGVHVLGKLVIFIKALSLKPGSHIPPTYLGRRPSFLSSLVVL